MKVSEPPEQELQTIVSHRVNAGDQTQTLCKDSKFF